MRKKQLPPQKEGEIDPKLLELLLSAPKKDYERICFEFGVTDFRWLLKRLNQLKKEREDEQAKVPEIDFLPVFVLHRLLKCLLGHLEGQGLLILTTNRDFLV